MYPRTKYPRLFRTPPAYLIPPCMHQGPCLALARMYHKDVRGYIISYDNLYGVRKTGELKYSPVHTPPPPPRVVRCSCIMRGSQCNGAGDIIKKYNIGEAQVHHILEVSCFLAKQHSNSFSSSSRFGLVLHHCKRVISLICKFDILFVI